MIHDSAPQVLRLPPIDDHAPGSRRVRKEQARLLGAIAAANAELADLRDDLALLRRDEGWDRFREAGLALSAAVNARDQLAQDATAEEQAAAEAAITEARTALEAAKPTAEATARMDKTLAAMRAGQQALEAAVAAHEAWIESRLEVQGAGTVAEALDQISAYQWQQLVSGESIEVAVPLAGSVS